MSSEGSITSRRRCVPRRWRIPSACVRRRYGRWGSATAGSGRDSGLAYSSSTACIVAGGVLAATGVAASTSVAAATSSSEWRRERYMGSFNSPGVSDVSTSHNSWADAPSWRSSSSPAKEGQCRAYSPVRRSLVTDEANKPRVGNRCHGVAIVPEIARGFRPQRNCDRSQTSTKSTERHRKSTSPSVVLPVFLPCCVALLCCVGASTHLGPRKRSRNNQKGNQLAISRRLKLAQRRGVYNYGRSEHWDSYHSSRRTDLQSKHSRRSKTSSTSCLLRGYSREQCQKRGIRGTNASWVRSRSTRYQTGANRRLRKLRAWYRSKASESYRSESLNTERRALGSPYGTSIASHSSGTRSPLFR